MKSSGRVLTDMLMEAAHLDALTTGGSMLDSEPVPVLQNSLSSDRWSGRGSAAAESGSLDRVRMTTAHVLRELAAG